MSPRGCHKGMKSLTDKKAKSAPSSPALPTALVELIDRVESRQALGADLPIETWTHSADDAGEQVYQNKNDRLDIEFTVERYGFPHVQTMDPRLVRIPPGKCNEYHKHAHESLFVILKGEGEVRVGDEWRPVRQGDLAFVPRWIFHQSRNTSTTDTLVILAITDFGFTKAVLGDYDKRTRLAEDGTDAAEH